jgi:hypothetical protein
MILLLVVSGLYAAFVIGAMTLGTLVWLEAAALVLGVVAFASARGAGRSIRALATVGSAVECGLSCLERPQ